MRFCLIKNLVTLLISFGWAVWFVGLVLQNSSSHSGMSVTYDAGIKWENNFLNQTIGMVILSLHSALKDFQFIFTLSCRACNI